MPQEINYNSAEALNLFARAKLIYGMIGFGLALRMYSLDAFQILA